MRLSNLLSASGLCVVLSSVSIPAPVFAEVTDCITSELSRASDDQVSVLYAAKGFGGLGDWKPSEGEIKKIIGGCGLGGSPTTAVATLIVASVGKREALSALRAYNLDDYRLRTAWRSLSPEERIAYRDAAGSDENKPERLRVISHLLTELGSPPLEARTASARPGIPHLIYYYEAVALAERAQADLTR